MAAERIKESEEVTGLKIKFFSGSHLAPKYFKVVANSKKLVAIMTHTHTHTHTQKRDQK